MSFPAEAYEKSIVPALFGPWSSYLVSTSNVQPDERILDVACGTGIVARQVALLEGLKGQITGLDINPNMLRVARKAAEREGLHIHWCTGNAEQLPFNAGSFDLILCQFGLMFFQDRHACLMEMQRVLTPNKRIVLSVWQSLDRHPFYQALHEVSLRYLGISVVADVFSLGDHNELLRLLTTSGFKQVEIEPITITARFPDPQAFLSWEIDVDPAKIPALEPLDSRQQQEFLANLRLDMQLPLQQVMQENQVVIPFHAYIAFARR